MSRPYQDLKPTFLPVTIFALLCCAVRGNEFGLNRPQQNYDAHYGPVIGIVSTLLQVFVVLDTDANRTLET